MVRITPIHLIQNGTGSVDQSKNSGLMIKMKDIKLAEVILGTKPKRKRKTISQSLRTRLYMRSKGKCERCNEPFEKGMKPHLHHKDGDPKNNKSSNFEVLCPNCHSRTRTFKKPKTKTSRSIIWDINSPLF